jgi:hypothetical protein
MTDSFDAIAYLIAEQAHKGLNDNEIQRLCHEAAQRFRWNAQALYRASNNQYNRHFAREYA